MKSLIIANQEESVIIHNAVIFMSNDLMEEIVDLEALLKERTDTSSDTYKGYEAHLSEMKRRWEVMVNITERLK